MLDDDDRVATRDEGVEGVEQRLDVVEVQAGGGLVEDEEGARALLAAEIVGQLYALVLAAGEGGGGLPELDVAQAHVLQGAEAGDDLPGLRVAVGMCAKELDGLRDGHLQHVVDVGAVILHL